MLTHGLRHLQQVGDAAHRVRVKPREGEDKQQARDSARGNPRNALLDKTNFLAFARELVAHHGRLI